MGKAIIIFVQYRYHRLRLAPAQENTERVEDGSRMKGKSCP